MEEIIARRSVAVGTKVDSRRSSSYVDRVRAEDALFKLIKKYGIRRAMVLYGAAAVAAQQGWEALVSPDGYTRQGVWTWKRDLEEAGVDPFAVEWGGYEKGVGKRVGRGLVRVKESIRQTQKKADARAARGRVTS